MILLQIGGFLARKSMILVKMYGFLFRKPYILVEMHGFLIRESMILVEMYCFLHRKIVILILSLALRMAVSRFRTVEKHNILLVFHAFLVFEKF